MAALKSLPQIQHMTTRLCLKTQTRHSNGLLASHTASGCINDQSDHLLHHPCLTYRRSLSVLGLNYQTLPNRKGFTLIELIVAITVISIMSALIVPRVIQYVNSTKMNVLLYNMTTIRRQLARYARDHDGCYPRCLRELVEKQYLPSIPEDPYTERAYWEIAIWSPDSKNNYWVSNGGAFVTTEAVVPLKMYGISQLSNLGYPVPADGGDHFRWDTYGICNVRVGDPENPYYTTRQYIDELSTDEAGTLVTIEALVTSYPNYSQIKNP